MRPRPFLLLIAGFVLVLVAAGDADAEVKIGAQSYSSIQEAVNASVSGDEITKTEIKDSVVSKSSIGGGSSKMQELEKLKEMFDSGFISKKEMEEMKKEILGK